MPSSPVYTATKHGVIGFTRAIAVSHFYTRIQHGGLFISAELLTQHIRLKGFLVPRFLPFFHGGMSLCSRVTSLHASAFYMMHVSVVSFSFPESLFRSGLWRAIQRNLPLVRPDWLGDWLWRQIREISSTVRCNQTNYSSRDADVSFPSVCSLIPVWRELGAVHCMASGVNRQLGLCLELRFYPNVSDSSTSQIALDVLELVTDETKNDAVLQINMQGNEYLTLPELDFGDEAGI